MERENASLIVDAHSDIPHHLLLAPERDRLIQEEHLPLLKEGGVDLSIANIFTAPKPTHPLQDSLLELTAFWGQVAELDDIAIISSQEEMDTSLAKGRLGFFLSLEGLEPLESNPDLLWVFYQLGVRLASLTWNHKNAFASGAVEEGGLTPLGRSVLTLMQQLGIILDVSHLNEESFWEVLESWAGPVFASHSNSYSLYPHPRNLKDSQIKALVQQGGVVGLNNYMTGEVSTLDTYLEHIQYMVDLVGEDHVGLGLDFNGYLGHSVTPGMEDPCCIPVLQDRLEREGFSSSVVQKIMGGNFYQFLGSSL